MRNERWLVIAGRAALMGVLLALVVLWVMPVSAATAIPPQVTRKVLAQPPGPFGPPVPAGPCGELQSADFTNVPGAPASIMSTQIVSATDTEPEYCQVTGMIEPQIQFELWLPTTAWNNRYLQVGCGGYCGGLQPSDQCTAGLAEGFAVAFNNTGHIAAGMMGGGDAIWATTDQYLRADFGYRSEHVVADVSKAIIAKFYDDELKFSYYQGCSNGGRQALQEAQTWPDDFDGIIAGAPAAIQAPLNGEYETWNGRANTDAEGNALITQADLTLLNNAALENCDAADGLVDNQITDPRLCTFDPATLLCPAGSVTAEASQASTADAPPALPAGVTLPLTGTGALPELPAGATLPLTGSLPALAAPTATETATCLTESQVEAVEKLYGGPVTADGKALYPGHEAIGSELGWTGWIVGMGNTGSMATGIGSGYLKYLGFPQSPPASYQSSDWEFTTEGFDQLRTEGAVYNATNPDLSAFVDHGGKLILYHGWADPAISPFGTVAYYQAVQDTMGGLEATQDFARLYMVPGMFHCSGGDAPNEFDMLTPIQNWVEKGEAPEAIIATQMSGSGMSGGFADPTSGGSSDGKVVRTRPLCPYPQIQTYSGSGDINDAANFECTTPDNEALIDGHYDWIGNDLFQAAPPVIEAPVLVNPVAGAATTNFLFTAQGFAPGERIDLSFRLVGSDETLAHLDDAYAQIEGYVTWTWKPGSETEPGDYEIIAHGTESDNEVVASVSVVEP